MSGHTWASLGPTKADKERIKILARHLAKHFQDDRHNLPDGGCACLGMDEGCVGCPAWWEQFLEEYGPDDVVDMHEMFTAGIRAGARHYELRRSM